MRRENSTPTNHISLKELQEWLEQDLFEQVNRIVHQRETFKSWNDIREFAPAEVRKSGFGTWVDYNYIQALAVAIRRLCDDGRQATRSSSLYQFLVKVGEYAHDQGLVELSKQAREDRKSLKKRTKKIKLYINSYIAHLDKERRDSYQAQGPVTLEDLHNTADEIWRIYRRWFREICNTHLAAPFRNPWEVVFTYPWITKDQASKIVARRNVEGVSQSSGYVRTW